ncbi:hypothetical protein EJV46_20960 [Roseococcus sp. SYP-B2431]|uniref:hypothetical protein n=1 Tax=Roseococcus sp. SYP-B2431 TaxID=2496640 RepID=UPI001039680D|nr:hypothetical protein [Roseococcus sp. SYP-B2431]TCH96449.1 hypothetical protein EJV46_20960 [Roseococcus sp. SYP-B2431]
MRRAWVKAWAVTAFLGVATGLAMAITPHSCNFHGRCPWTSDLGLFLIGAPLTALSFLVALGMSLYAWWRAR